MRNLSEKVAIRLYVGGCLRNWQRELETRARRSAHAVSVAIFRSASVESKSETIIFFARFIDAFKKRGASISATKHRRRLTRWLQFARQNSQN